MVNVILIYTIDLFKRIFSLKMNTCVVISIVKIEDKKRNESGKQAHDGHRDVVVQGTFGCTARAPHLVNTLKFLFFAKFNLLLFRRRLKNHKKF